MSSSTDTSGSGVTTTGPSFTPAISSVKTSLTLSEPSLAVTAIAIEPL
jgi:hypothetical protein